MNDNFSKNLRKLRLEKKMTQEQVAEKLGVSAQSVSRWENGATFPDVMMLPEIARMYGVLVDDLFKKDLEGYANLASRLVAEFEVYYKNEDFMAAVTEYERMIKEGSMDAGDYRGYGWLHTRMLQISKKRAIECIDKALELSKENPEEFYSIKQTRQWILAGEIGDGQRCIEEQLQAVKDEPENVQELVCLGWAYYWAKQYEECYRIAQDGIAKFPEEPDFYNLAGDACRELKKYDEAFAYWEKHREFETGNLESLYSIADCSEELGDYERAYDAFMKLVDIAIKDGCDVTAQWPLRRAEGCKAKMGKDS